MRFALAAALWLLPLADAGTDEVLSPVSLSAAIRTKSAEAAASSSSPGQANRRLWSGQNRPSFLNSHRRFHTLSSDANRDHPGSDPPKKRQTAKTASQESCDSAFLNCMPHEKCLGCFATMQEDDVDWASVKPETLCTDIVKFLVDNGKCKDLESDQAEKDVFCNTFDNCVVWDDAADSGATAGGGGNGTDSGAGDEGKVIDCDSLAECDWPDIHKGFLGDGICHDAVLGCYNHEICKFDGGDCCEDTCVTDSDYAECGMDGYACRDPKSKKCDPFLSTKCPIPEGEDDDAIAPMPECGPDEVVYRLVQYDSWGDGWDATKMTIKEGNDDAGNTVYTGSLDKGAEGTVFLCLSTKSQCYHVLVNGGIWGNEISWEVRPLTTGAPPIADGGAPQDCTFSVGGDACEKTCDGRPDKAIQNDPDYKGYMDLLGCLKNKCLIQIGACEMDEACKPCMLDDPPGYCFINDNYNALIDCALCRCTPEEARPTEFCSEKTAPGSGKIGPAKPDEASKDKTGVGKTCNADQTLKGAAAVMKFSQCSSVDSVNSMVTNFDENNFGALDAFERCSHAYNNENMHGGKAALDCMRILNNAMTTPAGDEMSDAPVEAIAALATNLYQNAETFCSCASDAAKECPLCESFAHFKTLLYETLDACKALDEIDCDAWNEFYEPCKSNLVGKFDKVDFRNPNQCEFVKDACGGVGPFPAFRKLDCGKEIPKPAWDFYSMYDRGCVSGNADSGGGTPVPPEPKTKPTDTRPAPAPHEDAPKPASNIPVSPPPPSTPKKYVPPPDDEDSSTPASNYVPSSSSQPKPKKKHHFFVWFVVFCLAGAAYWYHKRRSDAFDFVRYRRARNWGTTSGMGMGGGSADSEMFSGLNVDMSGSSFEPPTLPPTPSAYEGTTA